MKVFYRFVSLFFVALFTGICSESYIPNAKHDDHPGKCYFKPTEYVMDIDEVYKPVNYEIENHMPCAMYTCQEEYLIRVNHCTRYTAPSNCKVIPMDFTKIYPDCCPQLQCVDEDGVETIRPTTSI